MHDIVLSTLLFDNVLYVQLNLHVKTTQGTTYLCMALVHMQVVFIIYMLLWFLDQSI